MKYCGIAFIGRCTSCLSLKVMVCVAVTLISAMALTSCGMLQTMAAKATGKVFYQGTKEIETETNWESLRNGLMANLKIIEGLLYLAPHDETILVAAMKGYSGQAFAIDETLWLDDLFAERSESIHAQRAIFHYSRALNYGVRFLEENDITYSDLISALGRPRGIYELLDQQLSNDSLNRQGIFFIAQSLAGLINLQKDDIKLIAQLPIAKEMFDWVCDKEPQINFGGCQIFYGAYWASRPRMLGGSKKKAQKVFAKLMREQPDNWLGHLSYLQYYLIPYGEKEAYGKKKTLFANWARQFKAHRVWKPNSDNSDNSDKSGKSDKSDKSKSLGPLRLRLYQAIALKRFDLIKKYEKDFF